MVRGLTEASSDFCTKSYLGMDARLMIMRDSMEDISLKASRIAECQEVIQNVRTVPCGLNHGSGLRKHSMGSVFLA